MEKINTIILSFVLVITLLCGCSSATVFKVGDSDGWTPRTDLYKDWIKGKKFHVGDSLIFEYGQYSNDVTQVYTALEYENCDFSSPKVVYTTGYDVLTFTEPGYHFFITSNSLYCRFGQRLEVVVVYDPPPLVPPPPSAPPPSNVTEESDSYDDDDKWSEENKEFEEGNNLVIEYGYE